LPTGRAVSFSSPPFTDPKKPIEIAIMDSDGENVEVKTRLRRCDVGTALWYINHFNHPKHT
jgi:hypothetical protein